MTLVCKLRRNRESWHSETGKARNQRRNEKRRLARAARQ